MTIIRINGKVTTTTRAIKRDRRHARKSQARQTSEQHLANLRLQAFNYNAKQSRRWLRARLLSEDHGFVTEEAALQLAKHFQKTEHQLKHPRITDTVLTADARRVFSELELERDAARNDQGFPERVQDWWAAPTRLSKKKRKGKTIGKKQRATAAQSVSVEGLGDDVGAWGLGEEDETVEEMEGEEEEEEMEKEGGGVLLEESYEGFEGFDSPVMMSPTGSVLSDGEVE